MKARKRPDESFSDLLDRSTDRETDFETGFGALADVDFEGALAELDDRFDATLVAADAHFESIDRLAVERHRTR